MRHRRTIPCSTCPWRVGQGAATIPNYNHAKACRLMNSVGSDDAFRPIMACHGSTDRRPAICKGYLARAGWTNLAVRLMMCKGLCPSPERVAEACAARGIALEPDYPTVLAKLSEG